MWPTILLSPYQWIQSIQSQVCKAFNSILWTLWGYQLILSCRDLKVDARRLPCVYTQNVPSRSNLSEKKCKKEHKTVKAPQGEKNNAIIESCS